jgi:pyruvate ferredoxin oxidoreductase alpha subunit
VGIGGIVTENVNTSVSGLSITTKTVIAGLGGRPITKTSLHKLFSDAIEGTLEQLTFLDLDKELVEREIIREGAPQ